MTLPTTTRVPSIGFERIWVAAVVVRGEHIEGRGATGTDALVDLIDRLSDRLEQADA